MGSLLARAKPVDETAGFAKMVVYGRAGNGKTTFACTFPKPLLLVDIFERGTRSVTKVRGVEVIRINKWEELEQLQGEIERKIERGRFKYRSVVFDTMTQANQLAIRHALEQKGGDVKKGAKWGNVSLQMYGDVSVNIKNFITDIRDALEGEAHLVFVCQEKETEPQEHEFVDPDTLRTWVEKTRPEIGPRLQPAIVDFLNGAVDIIGQMVIRTTEPKRKGKVRLKRKPEEFALRIGRSGLVTTKVRIDKGSTFPHFIPDPDYRKLKAAIGEPTNGGKIQSRKSRPYGSGPRSKVSAKTGIRRKRLRAKS